MRKILLTLSLSIMLYSCNDSKNANPFFAEFQTENGMPPFHQIKIEHYMPAFAEGMKQEIAEVDAIVNNTEAPTFENTIVALDQSGKMLNRVSSVFFALNGAATNDSIQAIAKEITPMLSEHGDNINLNEKLFARIKAIYEDTTRTDYTTEQKRLIEKNYTSFVRSGIMLDAEKQTELREINKSLSIATLSFGQNLLAETSNYELVVDKQDDLAGLPADAVTRAAMTAKERGKEDKWVFTLSKASWEPFLQYADNRSLREELYKAMYNRGNNDNEFDNKKNIDQIIMLRLAKANMLGFNTHADYTLLGETMADNPNNVFKLLNDIWKYALPQAKKESAELKAMAKKEGKNIKIESWDWWYYAEKVRKEKYALNEDEVKPYFKAENVRDGVFMVANKLYGINFKKIENASIYHQDVQAFEVSDADGSLIGTIYLDYYAREGKRVGAWMGSFRKQQVAVDGKFVHPVIYNVGNFTPPTDSKPALLSIDEVETLFHEFGHGLHGLLSKCNYYTLSGTAVPRDFVELPSQVMEHWAFEPQVLKMYAKHYETGEVISDELITKIQNASTFNQGFRTTELVAAAILDMRWHTITMNQAKELRRPDGITSIDIEKFEANAMTEIGLVSEIIPRYRSTYFAHIFSGGYSAGYYSYLWSEVLDADAYQAFVEKGNIFDQATAKSFRENVLSKGGSEEPMTLYKNFRGAQPNPIYLLKNRGFVK